MKEVMMTDFDDYMKERGSGRKRQGMTTSRCIKNRLLQSVCNVMWNFVLDHQFGCVFIGCVFIYDVSLYFDVLDVCLY